MAITLNGTSGPTFDAGQRITGDFTNSTPSIAVRTMLQSSVTNGASVVTIIPNGTSANAQIQLNNNSSPENGSVLQVGSSSTNTYINSNIFGTGTLLPLSFQIQSSEKMSIATDGTVTSTLGGMQVRSGTAVASTSGTSIDFTGIPSWVKRITVMFNGVSTNGSSNPQVQLGDSGGIETTGYLTGSSIILNVVGSQTYTSGFVIGGSAGNWSSSRVIHGQLIITNVSGNNFVASSYVGGSDAGYTMVLGGSKSLSDVLTQIRITTVNGTDTFDAGSINILYE